MKYTAALILLFAGMVEGYGQDFITIEMVQNAKQVVINVPVNVKPSIEKEHLKELRKAKEGEGVILLSSLPLETIVMTSSFGKRKDPFHHSIRFHQGIDLKTDKSAVYSILHGKVVRAGFNSSLGNFIEIQSGKYVALYGHLSSLKVNPGDRVRPGDIIGISGSTGKSTGDHLHLTIKKGDKYVNPLLFLKAISSAKTKNDLLTILTEYK